MGPERRVDPELTRVAADLNRWMNDVSVPYAFVGGFAVAFLGEPRATGDLDAVMAVSDDRLKEVVASGARHGFFARREDALEFAESSRVLLLVHQPTGVPVDLSLAGTSLELEAIELATHQLVGDQHLPIPPPEHIAVMKALARRPRDVRDIEGLLDRHPHLNLAQIRSLLGELAEILEDPGLLEDFDTLVERWRASHP